MAVLTQKKVSFKAHKNLITGCKELINSNLVATSSLDTTVKVWNLERLELVAELRDVDSVPGNADEKLFGITSIDYSKYYGGFLVTTSFTQYINVWAPDASLSKSFSGRLEGHSSVVVSCRIFHRSPQCVSLDMLGELKVWDLRNFIALQTIRVDG